jgi:hypothetical protein
MTNVTKNLLFNFKISIHLLEFIIENLWILNNLYNMIYFIRMIKVLNFKYEFFIIILNLIRPKETNQIL